MSVVCCRTLAGCCCRYLAVIWVFAVVWALLAAPALGQPQERTKPEVPGTMKPAIASGRKVPAAPVYVVRSSVSGPGRLYSGTVLGLFVSQDGGESWSQAAVGGTNDEVFSAAVSAADPDLLLVGRRDGLWKSSSGGKSWERLANPVAEPYVPLALATADSRPAVIYTATARHGVFRSADGGQSWLPAGSGLPEAPAGGRAGEFRTLLVDPFNPDTAYIGNERAGIYRTVDGGGSWQPVTEGAPFGLSRGVYPPQMVFDPLDPNRLFVVLGHRIHSHLVQNRLYVIINGAEWAPVEATLPDNTRIGGLTADPAKESVTLWSEEAAWEAPMPPRVERSLRSSPPAGKQ